MRELSLGEILTTAQINCVVAIMKQADRDYETHAPLVAYLRTIKPPLESKGIDPAFLAYWLELQRIEGKL